MSRPSMAERSAGWLAIAGALLSACDLAAAETTPALTATSPAPTDTARWRVGLLVPPEDPEAECLRAGAVIAAELAMPQAGAPVEIVIRGRPGQWGDDGTEAARLALDDGVRGLITPAGGVPAHLVLQVSGRTGLPVVTLCPDSSILGTGIPWVLQLVPCTQDEARALFEGLRHRAEAPVKSWRAWIPAGRPGRGAGDDLRLAARAADIDLEPPRELAPGTDPVPPDRDWPGGILLWLGPEEAGRSARSLRAAGFAGMLAGPGWLDSVEFVAVAGAGAEEMVIASPSQTTGSGAKTEAFAERYRALTGRTPDAAAWAAGDAVNLLRHFWGGKETGSRVLQGRRVRFEGFHGTLEFEASGRRRAALHLKTFRTGRWIPLLP